MEYSKSINYVDVSISQKMYARLQSQRNTIAHVLAEFIDNAYQSYLDHKDDLQSLDSNYKFTVQVNFKWNKRPELSYITVKDNAFGIATENYENAFHLAHTPDNTSGMNEYGMGMKTAAYWLGRNWTLVTTALNEKVERTISFELDKVANEDNKYIPVTEKDIEPLKHYTEIKIFNLTSNVPSKKSLSSLNSNLASIYRQHLRSKDMVLIVNGAKLSFEEYPILKSPKYNNNHIPEGSEIEWKRDINVSLMRRYKAKGFIALLSNMDKKRNGLVLMRRGRAIIGVEEESRYFPRSLFGNVGGPRYKLLFGELEIEGFSVSFNKNGVMENDDLEALMEVIKGELHKGDFDLLSMADNYRAKNKEKRSETANPSEVSKHTNGNANPPKSQPQDNVPPKGKRGSNEESATTAGTTNVHEPDTGYDNRTTEGNVGTTNEPQNSGTREEQSCDIFTLDGKKYSLKVELSERGDDLIWLKTSDENNGIIECNINTAHPFFKTFPYNANGKSSLALLRAMAMAKFSASKGEGSLAEMFEYFNAYIREIKV